MTVCKHLHLSLKTHLIEDNKSHVNFYTNVMDFLQRVGQTGIFLTLLQKLSTLPMNVLS